MGWRDRSELPELRINTRQPGTLQSFPHSNLPIVLQIHAQMQHSLEFNLNPQPSAGCLPMRGTHETERAEATAWIVNDQYNASTAQMAHSHQPFSHKSPPYQQSSILSDEQQPSANEFSLSLLPDQHQWQLCALSQQCSRRNPGQMLLLRRDIQLHLRIHQS